MNDNRDAEIRRLHAAHWSIRALAKRFGLSPSRVQQITAAADDTDPDPWTDDDEAALVELPADDDYPPPPPWTFVGYEPVILKSPDCDVPRLTEEERWVDANGRSVDALAHYRWLMYQANDYDDPEGAERVRADMDRQRAEWTARAAAGPQHS
jgi:hypothetical protein